MNRTMTGLVRMTLAAAVGAIVCLLAIDDAVLTKSESLVSQAHAVIGRPLTPVSYAGVARRTARRDVVNGDCR